MALAGLLSAAGTAKGIHLDDPRALRLSTPQLIVMAWAIICKLMAKHMPIEKLLRIIAREITRDAKKNDPDVNLSDSAEASKVYGKVRRNADFVTFTALQSGYPDYGDS